MWVDSHCHLDFEAFNADRDEVLARARGRGVGIFLTISTRLSTFDSVHQLTEKYDDVYCTVGIHPHQSGTEAETTVAALKEFLERPKVIGIGESGLDFHYNFSDPAAQEKQFLTHIYTAQETQLPLVIHSRDADTEMGRILTENMKIKPFPFIMHCYSSGPELARTALDLGGFLSFSGILTFKNSEDLRQICKAAPLDRILVETDAPYLSPTPNRGKRCEPGFVVDTATVLSEVHGVPLGEIERQTTHNFFSLFQRIKPCV